MSSDAPATPPDVPWTQPNGIYATYDMHCHCGAIRYTMRISPPLYKEQTEGKDQCVAVECNCSHCERKAIIGVHPLAKDVEFTQGLEDRAEYYCGMKKNPVGTARKSVKGSLVWNGTGFRESYANLRFATSTGFVDGAVLPSERI